MVGLWLLVTLGSFLFGDRGIPIAEEPETAISDYDRTAFGGWVDTDGDCLDTRGELLVAHSLTPVVLDETGCRIVGGVWMDVYTGETLSDAGSIDIDHLVPLGYAWSLGAENWSAEKAHTFYNDPENLVITSASVNRSKGSNPPPEWIPPARGFQCIYLRQFEAVLARYDLTLSPDEATRMTAVKTAACN
jgi:hypothetical protein